MSTEDAKAAKEGNKKLRDIPVNISEGEIVTKKKHKKSSSYALKSLSKHLVTLIDDDLVTEEQATSLRATFKEITDKFTRREFGLS